MLNNWTEFEELVCRDMEKGSTDNTKEMRRLEGSINMD